MCMSLARFGHGHDSWQSQARDVYGHPATARPRSTGGESRRPNIHVAARDKELLRYKGPQV